MKSPTSSQSSNLWLGFWNDQEVFSPLAFEKCMEIFIENTRGLFSFSKEDAVLDIGSGPGALASAICSKVKSVDCLDISQRYLAECREKFKSIGNVSFHSIDPEHYTDLSFLGARKFSKIFCISVVQYYSSIDDVVSLIVEARKYALPGAIMIIADLPVRQSLVAEIATHFYEGFKRGYLFEILCMFLRAKRSSYEQIRQKQGALAFNSTVISEILEKSGVQAEILDQRLTVNGGRRHLLIRF